MDALRVELMGPSEPGESFKEFPTSRYVVGRLAPARLSAKDTAAAIDEAENDTLGAGLGSERGGDEDGKEDVSPPLIIGFHPSSFGLSFVIDPSATTLRLEISWGDYRMEKAEAGGALWRRYPRFGDVAGIRVDSAGPVPRAYLSPTATNPAGIVVTGLDDAEIVVEGVVHDVGGYRAVSIFLVNRRTMGALGDRAKDERWIYQPSIRVSAADGAAIFVAKGSDIGASSGGDDPDAATTALLYRAAREFASGHGVAAGWDPPTDAGLRTSAVFSEFIPEHEVPLLIAPSERTGNATLDMKDLASESSAPALVTLLEPMVAGYEAWIVEQSQETSSAEVRLNPVLWGAAAENLRSCCECAERMRNGLALIKTDKRVFDAFRFANRAMWDQRVSSLWAASNRTRGKVEGSASDFNLPQQRTWRPFQMGFILQNLVGIADERSPDRELVDLLWFPTGGGKTEAYLGLAAFTMALRRLRGERHGLQGDVGVSIIMRYTLRLLTIQQFQRAAALICACELIRREDPRTWGAEPFRIGVWVGRGTTPNTFDDSKAAIDEFRGGRKPRGGSPVQLVSCPRCGTALVDAKGFPVRDTYVADARTRRTLVWCPNAECGFSANRSSRQGIPVVVVDEEVYRTCPSIVVATVDKFARLPFKGETRALFGMRDRFSPTYGHLTEAHGGNVGSRRILDARAVPGLLPPELIIQDELHLISGPLGTMVGLYETVVQSAASVAVGRVRLSPKVIASTATIRRAAQQALQLYARKLAIFPPSGLASTDSFFASELPIDPGKDSTAGRLFVGINAPGSSTKTLLVRVYSALLALAAREIAVDAESSDPYGTLVGYFNSLRALGGAMRLVEDDVSNVRLRYLHLQRGLPRRHVSDPKELTSRVESWSIPGLLKELDNKFPRGERDWPVDVLLATNMISVGVDIDRLGMMVVSGQPKSTAEYIQATSRVGRKHPGLVVTMYNWMGARDLSHYERFEAYHAALYRHVEAISVTPFSSRALDRGLRGVFAALMRLEGAHMASDEGAQRFDPSSIAVADVIDRICARAAVLGTRDDAAVVRERLLAYRDQWARLGEAGLVYSWLNDAQAPPNNSRVLLRTSGTSNEGAWSTPGSLREVEPTAAFYLDEGEL